MVVREEDPLSDRPYRPRMLCLHGFYCADSGSNFCKMLNFHIFNFHIFNTMGVNGATHIYSSCFLFLFGAKKYNVLQHLPKVTVMDNSNVF